MKPSKVLFCLLVLFLNSCVFFEGMNRSYQHIHIINNSKLDIAFYPYSFLPVSLMYGQYYPDTLLPKENLGYYCSKISPMHDEWFQTIYDSKEIKERFRKTDSLMFYVFSVDTLNKYSWDEIREGYKILKRYDLSYEDLDSLNWTITYP